MIAVIDEDFDLGFEITRQEVVLQQDAVLQGLVPSLTSAWARLVQEGPAKPTQCLVLRIPQRGDL